MARTREHVISVEELLSRKADVVRTEAGETSRGRDISCLKRRVIEVTEQREEACELKKKRFEKLREAIRDHPNGGQKATPKIQKVPLLLHDHTHFDKYFKPRIVALGPIHHDTEKYRPAEAYKLRMTNYFVQDSGTKDEILYDIVEKNIEQLRKCFDEEVTKKYDDQALAWMLFVDGCAILQSIHWAVISKPCKDWKMKSDLMAFGEQDLFLLENQLPYQLLEDLMNSSAKGDELRKSINIFMNSQTQGTASPSEEGLGTMEIRPIHLLDLLRTRIIGKPKSTDPGSINAGEENERGDKNKRTKALLHEEEGTKKTPIQALLGLLRECLLPKRPRKGQNLKRRQSYRNVVELKAAGIYVAPSKTGSLTTVSFTKGVLNFYSGYLLLSPIIIDDSTGPKFLNLIAYEMCPDFYNNFEVASYISFLDSLIDHASDVMELRNSSILHNLLGSDKEVAQLFNEIGTDLVPDPDAYKDVKADIQIHYETQWKTWMAEALQDHFRSPWTILAFSAAIIVLGLTFIQTWFAFKEDRGDSRPRVRR